MRLLVDIGNTRIKWALADGSGLQAGTPLPARAEGLRESLQTLWLPLPVPAAVHIACVAAPALVEELRSWAHAHWACPVEWVRSSQAEALGVVNAYRDPPSLGIDRWLALLAARRRFPGHSVCIADCGTALTIDLLGADGRHRGGLIAPGLRLASEALKAGAHRLAAVQLQPAPGFADDTGAGIRNGVLWSAVGLIRFALEEARERLGESPVLLLTGGDGEVIAPCLRLPSTLAPDLVLEGLSALVGECV